MLFSSLIAISLTAAAPAGEEALLEKRSSFPIPYIGESLRDYMQQLVGWVVQLPLITDVGNFDRLVSAIPTTDISFNLNFLQHTSKTDDIPGYNTDFEPVDGIDSASVRWLAEVDGRTKDDPVVLYFHGGGYVLGFNPAFASFWENVWKDYNTRSDRLSVLLVDYAIAPNEGVWPKPLQQAAGIYNKLSETSDNVILAGDSAGGHLALSLLRHIKYPWENVPEISAGKPQGLVGLSPWVNIWPDQGKGIKNGTYATYDGLDILNAGLSSAMGNISVPDFETRTSSQMNFWKDYINWEEILPDPAKIFISYGDQEVLKGDILTWLNIANLQDSQATIYRDLAGNENTSTPSGTHDNLFLSGRTSKGYGELIDFLTHNFA